MDGKGTIAICVFLLLFVAALVWLSDIDENRRLAKIEKHMREGENRMRKEAVENGAAEYYEAGTARSFRWINRADTEMRIRNEAVVNGVAEFYIDENNEKQFRWLKLKDK